MCHGEITGPHLAGAAVDLDLGDDLGVLNKARQIINDPGSDDLIIGEREFLRYAIFMPMDAAAT